MDKFETIIIIDPDLSVEEKSQVVQKYEDLINKIGKLQETQDLGVKTLAYAVRGRAKGHYLDFYFKSKSEKIKKLDEEFRKDDTVLKFITVRKED